MALAQKNVPLGVAFAALYVIGLPLSWPLDVLRRGMCRRRHASMWCRLARNESGLDAVAQGEVRCATISTRVVSTFASGPEEESCVLLSLRDGSERVVAWSQDLERAIADHGVQTVRHELTELGIANLFGWGAWLIACLLVSAAWASSWTPAVAAVVVLAALVALGLS